MFLLRIAVLSARLVLPSASLAAQDLLDPATIVAAFDRLSYMLRFHLGFSGPFGSDPSHREFGKPSVALSSESVA